MVSLAPFAVLGQGTEPAVKVEKGWVRAVPPAAEDTAAYMTFSNNSDHAISLTSITTPVAAKVIPMLMTRKPGKTGEILGMEEVSQLPIPPHGQLVLTPGETHLMLMGLKQHPKIGDKVSLTFHFQGMSDVTLELPVVLNGL